MDVDYGKNLKLARKWAGYTQKELATKAGVATITIRQYEAGKRIPSVDIWFSIADALHLGIDELNNAELLPTKPVEAGYERGFQAGSQVEEWQNHVIDELRKQEGYTGFEIEGQLIAAFSHLNPIGQQEAVKRVEELTEIPKYQKEENPAEDD